MEVICGDLAEVLARVGALVRQAEGTDNTHEAEAFLARAQKLATQNSIDLAVARATSRGRGRASPVMRQITIGERGTKGLATYVHLFVVIAHVNDVRVDAAHNSTWVIAFGLESDIATVQVLYASLLAQMARGSRAHLRSPAHRGGRVAAVTARLAYQRAFAERVGARLRNVRDEARRDAIATENGAIPSAAVALRDKDIELRDYHTAHSTARGTWRGHRRPVGAAPAASTAGDRAGRRARLGSDTELDGPPPGLPS